MFCKLQVFFQKHLDYEKQSTLFCCGLKIFGFDQNIKINIRPKIFSPTFIYRFVRLDLREKQLKILFSCFKSIETRCGLVTHPNDYLKIKKYLLFMPILHPIFSFPFKPHLQLKPLTNRKTRNLFMCGKPAGVKLRKEGKSIRAVEHIGPSHFMTSRRRKKLLGYQVREVKEPSSADTSRG